MTTAALFPAGPRAAFSDCGRYRYMLHRLWDDRLRTALFVGLNPSKAGRAEFLGEKPKGDDLDPTCRREIALAKRWGYGAWDKANLFAWISTDPKGLRGVDDPIGTETDAWIVKTIRRAGLIVCCWGNNVKLASPDGQRARDVVRLIRENARAGVVPQCFRVTKELHVEHSLYQKSDSILINVPEALYG